MDEREPPYDDPDKQPQTLTRNRHINDILYVAGRAPIENQPTYDIMFVTGAVEEDEATQHSVTTFGFQINQPAEYLKGATGIIKDVALRAGIDIDKCYYTAVCKWLLPRMKRAKPAVKVLKWGLPILMDEIKRTKPKIIVCLGKQAFDLLSDRKIGFNDAHGGWFWSTEAQAHLYLMYPPFALVGKPELYETFRIDFMEIARKQKLLAGEDIQDIPVRYEVIRDEQSLRDWVARMEELYDDRIPGVPAYYDPSKFKVTIPKVIATPEAHAAVRGISLDAQAHYDAAVAAGQIEPVVAGTVEQLEERMRKTREEGYCYGECHNKRAAEDPKFKVEFDRVCAVATVHHRKLEEARDAAKLDAVSVTVTPPAQEPLAGNCANWHKSQLDPDHMLFAVDCEWHGRTHVDGQLRTIQFAWTESDAVVIEFRNEQNEWSFELSDREWHQCQLEADEEFVIVTGRRTPHMEPDAQWEKIWEKYGYRFIGRILASVLNRKDVRYIGHHFSADAPWMEHWLGLNTYRRCVMDTEFAQQTVDESSELGLERGIAMKYTTLGLYNLDLILWKKDNPGKTDGGYGFIPSAILHPYACLRYDSKVKLASGAWSSIRHLVETRYAGEVVALVDGKVENCRVIGWHDADAKQREWYRLRCPSSRYHQDKLVGPVFTPDHELITLRGKVRVDQLVTGEDRIITEEPRLTKDQLSVLLGTLMSREGRLIGGKHGVRLEMRNAGTDFASLSSDMVWKVQALGTALRLRTTNRGKTKEEQRNGDKLFVVSNHSKQLAALQARFPFVTVEAERGRLKRRPLITEELLDTLGVLGVVVWFQSWNPGSDIWRVDLMPKDERVVFEAWLRKQSGCGHVVFEGYSWTCWLELMPAVRRCLIDSLPSHNSTDFQPKEQYAELVLGTVRTRDTHQKSGHRYCLTVEKAHNFLTMDGFVSNCLDVITPFRAAPLIRRQLQAQQLEKYYDTILNPFVTDVFTEFCRIGLPIDLQLLDELRELFHFVRRQMEVTFKENVHNDARRTLFRFAMEELGSAGVNALSKVLLRKEAPTEQELMTVIKDVCKMEDIPKWIKRVQHYIDSPNFNIRSPDMMRRWLFEVEGLIPVKTTNQKAKGLPSMAWEKVLELPADRQRLYTPAVDKQTLQILSEQFAPLDELLDLNAVGNLCKAFLKEADTYIDEETGLEVKSENGLHQWVAKATGRIPLIPATAIAIHSSSETGMRKRHVCRFSPRHPSQPAIHRHPVS